MNNSKLKKFQNELFDISKIVNEICIKNGIRFYMIGGTFLGAVRHKGFIPWDDDMDFAIDRNDYDKFVSCMEKNLPKNLAIQYYKNSKKIDYHFIKIIDKNKYVIEKLDDNNCEQHNMFIDIFPIDKIPSNFFNKLIYYSKVYINFNLWRIAKANNIYEKSLNKKLYSKKKLFVIKFFRGINLFNFLDLNKRLIKFDSSISSYKKDKYTYVSNVLGGNGIFKEKFKKNILEELALYDFENYKFYGVKKYDEMLKKMYGNYMKLPPKEKRCCKHIVEILYKEPKNEKI